MNESTKAANHFKIYKKYIQKELGTTDTQGYKHREHFALVPH